MPETIQGLGRVLADWREDDTDQAGIAVSINQWAAQLKTYGCSASVTEITTLLEEAEQTDHWTLTFSCDCFDDFLDAFKRGIYRGQVDAARWQDLYAVFLPTRKRLIGC